MYELIILSVLVQRPAHGYLIAKVVNNVLGPFSKVNNGRLYPLLAKLEKEGLIIARETTQQEGERHVKGFEISEAGRKYFHQLMLDTTSNPSDYQKLFWLKAPVLGLVSPAERSRLIDHYVNYCEAHVLHLEAKLAEYQLPVEGQPIPPNLAGAINAIQHRIDHWQLEVNWASGLRQPAG